MSRLITLFSAVLLSTSWMGTAHGVGDIDVRANQIITSTLVDINYRISIEDCTRLADISINGQTLNIGDAQRDATSNTCEFDVLLSHSDALTPSVTAVDIQGETY